MPPLIVNLAHMDQDDGVGVGADLPTEFTRNTLWEDGTPLPIIEIESCSAFSPTEHGKLEDFPEYGFDMSPMSDRRHALSPEIRRQLASSNGTELEMSEMGSGQDQPLGATPRGAQAEATKTDTGATLLSAPLERDQVDDDADEAEGRGVSEDFIKRKRERMARLKENLATENTHPDEEEKMPRYDGMQRLVGGQSGSSLGRGHAFYLQVMLYTGILTGIDRAFLGMFKSVDSHTSISEQFPSSVFAMVFVLASLCFGHYLKPGLLECLIPMCRPGVWFLAEWRPLFFYIPLLRLPLLEAPSGATVCLSLLTAVCGFGFTLLVTLGAVRLWDYMAAEQMSMREGAGYMQARWSARQEHSVERSTIVVEELALKAAITKRRWAWARLAALWLVTALLVMAAAALMAHYSTASQPWVLPYSFGISSAIFSFIATEHLLPPHARQWLLPPVTFTMLATSMLLLFAAVSEEDLTDMLKGFHDGTPSTPASGDLLELLLGPSIISLALEVLPERVHLVRVLPKLSAVSCVTAILSLYSTALLARLFGLPRDYAVSCVLQSVATPISVGLASVMDARDTQSLVVLFCCVSGLLGALFARRILSALRLEGYVPRGLSVGISSHLSGTSSLVEHGEIDAASIATCAYLVVGVVACAFLAIPPFRDSVINLAH